MTPTPSKPLFGPEVHARDARQSYHAKAVSPVSPVGGSHLRAALGLVALVLAGIVVWWVWGVGF